MRYKKGIVMGAVFASVVVSFWMFGATAYGQPAPPFAIPQDYALDPVPPAGNPPPSGPSPVDPGYSRSGLVPCSGPDCTLDDILVLGANVFQFLVTLVGIFAIGALVFAGFLYMTAAGNESQIAKAKQVATWAITGLVLALFSVVLIQFILSALEANVDVINEQ